MKDRAYFCLLIIGMAPVIALIPIWGIVYIFTGKSILTKYMDHMVDKQLDLEEKS